MNKYFKKFSIMFVMSLVLVFGSCVSAFADDSYEIGKTNLNGTTGMTENSANVGDQLKDPEVGWKRADDTNSNILYTGKNWVHVSMNGEYNNTLSYIGKSNQADIADCKVTFKFYGKKVRIINSKYYDYAKLAYKVDGKIVSYADTKSSIEILKPLEFEALNLELKEHTVEIYAVTDGRWDLDAIDIDKDGYLLSPAISLGNTSVSVDSSKQLTVTTTPAAVGVTWTSSDSSIAEVDSKTGVITGHKEGEVSITAAIIGTTVDGKNLSATCTVTVTKKDDPQPNNPTEPEGDNNLYIELVDGQIKQYSVSQAEISKFTNWYENRDKDHSLSATYKFVKDGHTDHVVHDKIDWFEVR